MGGYSEDRAADCYRMYNPLTNAIYETRDVIWLGHMYFSEKDTPPTRVLPIVSTEQCLQNDGSGASTDDELDTDPDEELQQRQRIFGKC